MAGNIADRIRAQVIETLKSPKSGLRGFLNLGLGQTFYVQAAVVIVIFGILLNQLVGELVPPQEGEELVQSILARPLMITFLQLFIVAATAALMFSVGRLFRGTGSFEDCLGATVWLQFLLLMLQIIQLIALFVFPAFAVFLSVAGIAMIVVFLVFFSAEVHGFTNIVSVLAGVVFTFAAAIVLIAVLLTILGFAPEIPPNV